ncbi:uncharacterized protein LOC111788058 [Cucurbita pepo subsp. pepo]|uniref:uncharacterized protein LOC111788058 n=1 Tax=Cucurbita pepo subsp. pepo TaxID=3664 RepID=UPI000C9D756C|nr:uncharacterized protein LOC111788058 [Cucurbita pepo subsp. pepo]
MKLKAIEATPESFAEYGQVIEPTDDGLGFGPDDAQLDLTNGTPRFYILHIENRPFNFSMITHHARVTQCLGSVDRQPWYLAVAKPSIVDDEHKTGIDKSEPVLRSKSGHLFLPPCVDEIKVFKISGAKFVKLNKGTWHAGPLFRESARDFYNLELTNTNVVDHTTYDLGKENGVPFEIED